jgi:hypothetical protein
MSVDMLQDGHGSVVGGSNTYADLEELQRHSDLDSSRSESPDKANGRIRLIIARVPFGAEKDAARYSLSIVWGHRNVV